MLKKLVLLLFFVPAVLLSAGIDINSNDVEIKLMGDLEGRSIIFKIKDKDGNNIGVFKPTSGSTFYRGEYASYKLAELIGLDIYSPSQFSYMTPQTQKKVLPMLEKASFNKKSYEPEYKQNMSKKEENRKTIIEELKRNIETEKNIDGVLKPWIDNLMFYKPLGSKKGFKLSRIYQYLKSTGPQPPHSTFILSQCTEIFETKGCVEGWSYKDQVAQDISSILVLDAVLGNSDRFAGGNLHFTSVDGNVETKKGLKIFKNARLFSLDNGAVLRPNDRTGFNILKELGITRFVKAHIEKLQTLKDTDEAKLRKDLGIGPEEFEIFKTNLSLTLAYIDELKTKHKEKIWFAN